MAKDGVVVLNHACVEEHHYVKHDAEYTTDNEENHRATFGRVFGRLTVKEGQPFKTDKIVFTPQGRFQVQREEKHFLDFTKEVTKFIANHLS